MHCIDCHNRPAHTFDPSADRAVYTAVAQGQIPRDLSFARREAVPALNPSNPSTDAAMTGIESRLREIYRPQVGDSAAALARTISGVNPWWLPTRCCWLSVSSLHGTCRLRSAGVFFFEWRIAT